MTREETYCRQLPRYASVFVESKWPPVPVTQVESMRQSQPAEAMNEESTLTQKKPSSLVLLSSISTGPYESESMSRLRTCSPLPSGKVPMPVESTEMGLP